MVPDAADAGVLNAFSIDVEGFIESNLQSFHIPDKYIDPAGENEEIRRNTAVLLELLDETATKATFFFIGRLARDIPDVVKAVADAGHEIACHNYAHIRVFGTDQNEFREKLGNAKKALEDVSGRQVYGFRAPDFSITEQSIWALDVLKELGFVYDSSVFPFGLHDVYGIKGAEPSIHKMPNGLIEVPMSVSEFFGRRIPFGGGGYFRLYPLRLTKTLIARANRRQQPVITYVHPYEIGPCIPKVREISAYRRFRHYYNCSAGRRRAGKLLKAFRFGPIIEVIKEQGLQVS